jgi:Flp pilus assembly protein TadD
LFQQDVAYREEKKAPGEARISRWAVARTLRSLGRLDEALALQKELAALPESDGYVFEEIGECLMAQGKAEEARPWFAKAHALLAPKAEAEGIAPERIARLKTLGGLDPAPPAQR